MYGTSNAEGDYVVKKGGASGLAGATAYEFRMQVRRKALWVLLILGDLAMLSGNDTPWKVPEKRPLAEAVGDWALTVQVILPLIFGILLAGRLPRDHKTGVDELLDTLPASSGGRLAGKFLGATLATATPIFFFYCIGIVYLAVDRWDWTAIPLGLLAFAAVNLPGLLFVGAFSIACTAILWVPLYQFLFTGYWFWGNWLLQGPQSPLYIPVPTLSGTLLTPAGYYAVEGLFGDPAPIVQATAREGLLSIGLLVAFGVAALYAAHRYLIQRKARR